MIRTNRFSAAALGLLLAAVACQNDEVNRPFANIPVDPLFERYVSMGNSITAGFQSGGINDSTQLQSYAVLLARGMRSPFFPPLLNKPGCPPPYTNVFTQTRLSGGTGTTCALRRIPTPPPPYISNTAVPGAEVIDIYDNDDPASNPNTLTQFILGGLTQEQMMTRAQPTFVSVWIGNNDVLGAATNSTNGGDSTLITPVADFQTRYGAMLATVEAAAPDGVILIGVASVVGIANRTGLPPTQPPANGVPFFAYGSTYFALDAAGAIPGPFTAAATCAPPRGDSVLVPFPFGGALIAAGGTLTCNEDQTIQPAEAVKLSTTVAAYNTYISAQATARGWAYLDPNPALDSLRRIPTQVAFFPNFGSPTPTPCSASPFGLAFSCDAIHPSAATHRLLAQKLRLAINSAYTTAIPPIP
ncbi:MAG TPA: SGNH/GDSL hydrolase family protein [Gemmatimonadales bacterium]|nr:SGNH/GDSL hydrolase family protein [Gemmatimonadales bacterium]